MIQIRTAAGLRRLRPLFMPLVDHFYLEAMIAGNCAFRAWADDPRQPQAAVVWDGRSMVFLLGSPQAQNARRFLAYLFNEILAPAAESTGQDAFLFHSVDSRWDEDIQAHFDGYQFNRFPRVLFTTVEEPQNHPLPGGYDLQRIDAAFLRRSLGGMEGLVEEIELCWPSRRRFLSQGYGFAAIRAGTIVSRITAEYIYPGQVGIGIYTVESERRKGLGVALTMAFLRESAERGLSPHWDAWKNNQASVRLAEKCGFIDPVDFSVLVAYR